MSATSLLMDAIGVGGSVLTGGAVGGVLRIGTEILAHFQKKAADDAAIAQLKLNNQHEIDMMDRMAAINKDKEQRNFDLEALRGELAAGLAEMKGALTLQLTKTGYPGVDKWNASLRPWLISTFIGIYCFYKVPQIVLAYFIAWKDVLAAFNAPTFTAESAKAMAVQVMVDLSTVWGEFEVAGFSGVANFLLVGRVFDKIRHK